MSAGAQTPGSPEQRVGRLVAHFRNHALWDSLLIFSPPLLVAIGVTFYLYQIGWIGATTFLLVGAAGIIIGLLTVTVRTRPLIPSVALIARLLDHKTAGKDRFLTLATIDPSRWPAGLVGRLRAEAAARLERIEFRREFPYRIKRSFYWSLVVSLFGVALFHLAMPLMGLSLDQTVAYRKIRELAEKMAERPSLSPLAHELQTLATKLQQPNLSEQEKEGLIQATLEQVEMQQKKEQEKESRAVLGEASSTLKGLEQQARQSQQKDSEKGGGVAQNNPSQEGRGETKQSQGGGDSEGQHNAERNNEIQQGQTAKGGPKEQSKETNPQGRRDSQNDQAQADKSDKDRGTELTGKTRGGSQEKPGRSRSEESPQGAPPAERFYKPGEQRHEGVKGARYVTVQLPEDLVADSQGEGTLTKQSKGARAYPKAPLSNVPLPAQVPDAPTERQQLPLEYRGIIR
ncbi:MAG TPA: hypothetical protein VEG60_03985 [Candidatus Binatia bacterium]|nr:hypothetical protein [Candidatus Binatia bacterium]